MTEDTAWVIEELNTTANDNMWWHYPALHDPDDCDDMEPTTLEECLNFLQNDPWGEHTKPSFWIVRIHNLVTHEKIMYSDICHK